MSNRDRHPGWRFWRSALTSPLPAVVPVTQADLAEMCGLSRPTVQQVLASLERRGLIKAGYRKIEIIDLARLIGQTVEEPPASRAGSAA